MASLDTAVADCPRCVFKRKSGRQTSMAQAPLCIVDGGSLICLHLFKETSEASLSGLQERESPTGHRVAGLAERRTALCFTAFCGYFFTCCLYLKDVNV